MDGHFCDVKRPEMKYRERLHRILLDWKSYHFTQRPFLYSVLDWPPSSTTQSSHPSADRSPTTARSPVLHSSHPQRSANGHYDGWFIKRRRCTRSPLDFHFNILWNKLVPVLAFVVPSPDSLSDPRLRENSSPPCDRSEARIPPV